MSTATGQLSLVSRWASYLDAPLAIEGSAGALALALAAGVAFDIGVRSGIAGVGGALAVFVASVALLVSGRIRSTTSRLLVAAAPLFGVWLAIRATPWLLPFDVMASASLLILGASLSSDGRLLEVSIPNAVARAMQAGVQALFVPAFLVRGMERGTVRGRRVLRGVAIAFPLVIVLGALFASADAVFAHAVHINIASSVGNVVLVIVGALGAAWLLRLASLDRTAPPDTTAPTLAPIEWTIVLGALDLVLAGFAAAQIVALSSGGKHVLTTAGLTYAQYARSGFFQLLAAIVITGLSLLALHAAAGRARSHLAYRVLAFTSIGLTFIVVVSAFHRLALYQHAYGMTMLRLYVEIAIVGAGVLLALLAVRIADVGAGRPWFAPIAGVLVLTTLLGLNVVDPAAVVARYNLRHPSAHFDPSYLAKLGPDAAGALTSTKAICTTKSFPLHGWAAFNLSRNRAQSLRKEHCP